MTDPAKIAALAAGLSEATCPHTIIAYDRVDEIFVCEACGATVRNYLKEQDDEPS